MPPARMVMANANRPRPTTLKVRVAKERSSSILRLRAGAYDYACNLISTLNVIAARRVPCMSRRILHRGRRVDEKARKRGFRHGLLAPRGCATHSLTRGSRQQAAAQRNPRQIDPLIRPLRAHQGEFLQVNA